MSEQDPQCPLDEDLLFLIQWPLNMGYTYRMPLLQTNPSKPGGECNKPNYGSTWFNYWWVMTSALQTQRIIWTQHRLLSWDHYRAGHRSPLAVRNLTNYPHLGAQYCSHSNDGTWSTQPWTKGLAAQLWPKNEVPRQLHWLESAVFLPTSVGPSQKCVIKNAWFLGGWLAMNWDHNRQP